MHKLLVILILFLSTYTQTVFAKKVALLIGNAEYLYENKLDNPVNDTRLLEKVLKIDHQFDEVKLVSNANVRQFYRAIGQFKESAKDAEIALVYYSGHGQQGENRQNYLLATDSQIENITDLKYSAISADELLESTEGAKTRLVILDACRDRPKSGFKSATKGLSRANISGQGLLVAYSTESGKVAQDGVAGTNSPYASALAKALQQKNNSILVMLDQVTDDVYKLTNGKQSPTREGNLRIDAYITKPEIISIPNNVNVPEIDLEKILWEEIQKDISLAGINTYLKQYPNGRFSNIARRKIIEYNTDIMLNNSQQQKISNSNNYLLKKGLWLDSASDLIWMRCSLGQEWDGNTCIGELKKYTWKQAQEVVNAINLNGGFAGFSDWQLPHIEDLASLRYCSKGFVGQVEIPSKFENKTIISLSCKEPLMGSIQKPTINIEVFPNTDFHAMYWSSVPNINYDNGVWGVNFSNGNTYGGYAISKGYVRLVRKK